MPRQSKNKTGVPNLFLRHQMYIFQKDIPPDLREFFDNKVYIKKSVGRRFEEAKLERDRLHAELMQMYWTLRNTPNPELEARRFKLRSALLNGEEDTNLGSGYYASDLAIDAHREAVQHEEEMGRITGQEAEAHIQSIENLDSILLSDATEEFLKEQEGQVSQDYLGLKRRVLSDLKVFTGNVPIQSISKKVAGNYVRKEILGNGRSAKTNKERIVAIASMFKHFELTGQIENNPFNGMSALIKTGKTIPKKRAYTLKELPVLVEGLALEKTFQKFMPLVEVALYSGMRAEEVCQLGVDQCKNGMFEVKKGKTVNAPRKIPIHSHLKPLVDQLVKDSKDGFLIQSLKVDKKGKRSTYVLKRFGAYKTKLGFDVTTDFHSLRRTFATALENAEVPPNVAAQLMGHSKEGCRMGCTLRVSMKMC
jgi:integrase